MYKWSNEWKRKGFYAILILFCGCCFIGISKKTKETEGEIQQKESVEESGVKEKPSIAITFDDDVIIGLSQEISYKEAVSMI